MLLGMNILWKSVLASLAILEDTVAAAQRLPEHAAATVPQLARGELVELRQPQPITVPAAGR